MVLNFHFYAQSDPIPDGHFRAMSGADAGRFFIVTQGFKARGYRHAHKMDESVAFAHFIYNLNNYVNSYCSQHPKRDDLI